MKASLWFGVGVVATILVVLAVLAGAWLFWRPNVWGMPMMRGTNTGAPCGYGPGRMSGRMGRYNAPMSGPMASYDDGEGLCVLSESVAEDSDQERAGAGEDEDEMDLSKAEASIQAYLEDIGYEHLDIAEIMAFERNFYAIVTEPETDIGAMEILVDRGSGAVGPEPGPNMMWNTKYGMHGGGMMGGRANRALGAENVLSEDEAVEIAQRWLNDNRSDLTADTHADAFYGYYTLHTLEADGEIAGMLSVHGDTGQVWYHTWHGDFLQMAEADAHGHEGQDHAD